MSSSVKSDWLRMKSQVSSVKIGAHGYYVLIARMHKPFKKLQLKAV